jgi:hypothetical protein
MNAFDESDEWFPAVGESDGYLTDEPGHVSELGDEEGMFVPNVEGHPAMVDDGEDEGDLSGVVNDVDLGQPAPNTPVAFLPVQNSISPNTSSSSLETPPRVGLSENGTGRRRLRKKTKAGPNREFEYFDKNRQLFMKHEILSSYPRKYKKGQTDLEQAITCAEESGLSTGQNGQGARALRWNELDVPLRDRMDSRTTKIHLALVLFDGRGRETATHASCSRHELISFQLPLHCSGATKS